MIAARIKAAPKTDPTTIPAIAPPDRPLLRPAAAAAEAVGEFVADVEGNSGGIDVVVGRRTFSQRFSTSELTQQESVELGELEAQKEQRPCRLESYPQSLGSFS